MLPLDRAWYRRLLGLALLLGFVAGVLAVVYMAITGAGSDIFFEDADSAWWSGEWWWIPLIAFAGLVVAWLRRILSVPDDVPGAVEYAHRAWVEPGSALRLAAVSAVSLVFGASLGPSFGLVIMGGGLGSWVAARYDWGKDTDEARQQYTLTGMTGGLGGAFSAPIFGAVLGSELSPTPKQQYVTAFIPQVTSATVGFMVFFGVTGSSILDIYELPPYDFEFHDLFIGVALGALSMVVLVTLAAVMKIVSLAAAKLTQPLVRGLIGGGLVGLIGVALPLTLTSGKDQLATLTDEISTLGVGFLAAILLAKMFAVALSLSAGFLGGNVFPMIFIGGTSGILVHTVVPGVPPALAVGAMMAAVPGGFLNAPLSMILIAAGTVSLGGEAIAPVGLAVVTAYLITAAATMLLAAHRAPTA